MARCPKSPLTASAGAKARSDYSQVDAPGNQGPPPTQGSRSARRATHATTTWVGATPTQRRVAQTAEDARNGGRDRRERTVTSWQLILAIATLISLGLGIHSLTQRRDSKGLNLSTTRCPKCDRPLPRVRRPASWQQAMYGGSTCRHCGTEVDKWGREIAAEGDE